MLERFRAKPFTGTDLANVKNVLLPGFDALHAYPDGLAVEAALEQAHAGGAKSKRDISSPVTNSRIRRNRAGDVLLN